MVDEHATIGTNRRRHFAPARQRTRIRRLIALFLHILELQWHIIWLRIQLAFETVVVYAALLILAALLAFVSFICVCIGLFQLLTLFVPVPWAWLIFGGVSLAAAGATVWIAQRMLHRRLYVAATHHGASDRGQRRSSRQTASSSP